MAGQDNKLDKGKRVFMRPTDLLIVGLILLAGLSSYLIFKNQNISADTEAHIFFENELIAVLPLTEDEEKDLVYRQCPGITFRLYKDGSIAFLESSCPDKVCINSGKMSEAGDWAACLPNRVLVRVVGLNDSEVQDVDLIG
ncbi:MAG TPA: NusG domain II-containing protein [Clostridiaceae bacterium]|nr:NusG domain II-containing protein [Clostridiaceae bacterium]